MATQPQTGLTYPDLQAFPEDNLRRELIDGELIVTAAPATRHQRVVAKLLHRVYSYCERNGGEVLPAPFDVYFSETNVVEPDIVFVRPENRERFEERFFRSAPDLVVEVSSPSTRRLELIRKRDCTNASPCPNTGSSTWMPTGWRFYRLEESRYGRPLFLARGETLETPQAPGFALAVDDLLGPAED